MTGNDDDNNNNENRLFVRRTKLEHYYKFTINDECDV